jgi:flagellar hook-associated protein 1 FlgK
MCFQPVSERSEWAEWAERAKRQDVRTGRNKKAHQEETMRPTFMGFEASKTALFATQKAMDITGHNLANISSKGYTRQRADQVALSAGSYTSRFKRSLVESSGLGCKINGIQQIRDARLDQAFRNAYANTGYYDTKTAMLEDIQGVLQELDESPNGNGFGLRSAIQEVYVALQEWSLNANSDTNANIVATSLKNMTKTLNAMSVGLENSAQEFRDDLHDRVNEVNLDLEKIDALNRQIMNSMVANNYNAPFGPNELFDERNVLLDELSRFGEIEVQDIGGGLINVRLNGHLVVNGEAVRKGKTDSYEQIVYQPNMDGTVEIRWQSNGDIVDAGVGALSAYVSILNGRGVNIRNPHETIDNGFLYYRDKINTFASMFADVVNQCIPEGYDEKGNVTGYKQLIGSSQPNGSVSMTLPVTAGNIYMSEQMQKDYSYIIPDKNSKDNTHILNMIQQLMTDKHQFELGGTRFNGTFEDFVGNYASTLGNDISFSSLRLEASLLVVAEAENTRDSVSSVNESEETANMLMQNRTFQSAARMMTAMDDLLDVIINRMGLG